MDLQNVAISIGHNHSFNYPTCDNGLLSEKLSKQSKKKELILKIRENFRIDEM